MKWGLSSPWMKHQPTNIRSDNKGLKMQKRCIVLTQGFYEWQRKGSNRQPYYIFRKNSPYVLMAGVYEVQTNQTGEQHYTFAIVTTDASKPMSFLHHRMPVIFPSLTSTEAQLWLNSETKWGQNYEDLLKPYEEDLTWYKVSSEVNKVSNDSKRCIEKLEESKMNIQNFIKKLNDPVENSVQIKEENCKPEFKQAIKEDSTFKLDQDKFIQTTKTEPDLLTKQSKRDLSNMKQEADKDSPKKKTQKITHFFQRK
ncbi:hypothetical protein K7432_015539 [Basidiobolus ranarum]